MGLYDDVANHFITGVHISSGEVFQLRAVAQEAAKKKQSIIFLPCHKSHVDYVSLQIICYRLGIGLPVVVAGDNLNIPLLGPFLQHAGMSFLSQSENTTLTFHRCHVD